MALPTTLYEFYTSLGMSLPSIATRAELYESYGLGSAGGYTGTAAQNTALLQVLNGRAYGNEAALQFLEQYRSELTSITIGDALEILADADEATLGAFLSAYGITLSDYSSALDFLRGYSQALTFYDFCRDLLSAEAPLDQPVYEVPEGVQWQADEGSPGSYESPAYVVDPDTGAWTIRGLTDAVRETIPVQELKFYAGQGKAALLDGASTELTNIVMDFVERSIPTPLFRMITAVQEAESVSGLLRGFLDDTLAELERGADALVNGGIWDDGAIWNRARDFQRDLGSHVLGQYGGPASGIYDAIGRTRVVVEHSDLTFVAEDSETRPAFVAPAGHHVAAIGALSGDDLTGGKLSDLLVGRDGRDVLKGAGGNDRLYGGPGNDQLNGGLGADLMDGGSGNDIYFVDSAGDKVYETTATTNKTNAGGVDKINSAVTFNLSAYTGVSFVENLTLTGTTAINGIGNALANTLMGNNAANVLRGANGNDVLVGSGGADSLYGDANNDLLRGGAGNDILWGGLGNDIFRFDAALSTARVKNVDQIKDFNPARDTIQLENSIFTKFGTGTTGTINPAFFRANTSGLAQDSNDYIIYETDTGKLFYDSNGNAAGGSVQIAVLGVNLAMTSADYVLI